MVGLAFEKHVAATNKGDPGNNHDLATMRCSERKELTGAVAIKQPSAAAGP